MFAVIGIGPDFAASDAGFAVEVEGLIKNSRKIVGIGEIGLDAKVAGKSPLAMQKEVFAKQVQAAKSMEMPAVIHSRGMFEETLKIIEDARLKRVMFHFFEGDEKQAAALAKKGYFISIPPVQTSKRKRIIKEVDLNSIVVETDSPIVGKKPSDVVGVCETVARIKGTSLDDVAEKTTENIRRLFNI